MGRYGALTAGEPGFWLAAWYESYSPSAAALFLDSEAIPYTDAETGVQGATFKTTAGNMRDRLELLGYTSGEATLKVNAAWPTRAGRTDDNDEALPEKLITEWLAHYGEDSSEGWNFPHESFHHIQGQWGVMWGVERWQVRYLVDRVPDDVPLTLDLSEVWGTHEQEFTPTFCADARAAELADAAGSLPTIVLTEGSTDAEVLNAAVKFARPHLAGFITFLDYSMSPVGSVDAVVRAIRAFGAAGVGNQVIGLLDNDLAGKEGFAQIASSGLPSHMRPLVLPELDIAKAYPAHGTEGLAVTDINGRAVSIELFMGEDVLRESDGELSPVQWTGFMPKFSNYQGSLINKRQVQDRFRAKVKRAESVGAVAAEWEDLGMLLDYLVNGASEEVPLTAD